MSFERERLSAKIKHDKRSISRDKGMAGKRLGFFQQKINAIQSISFTVFFLTLELPMCGKLSYELDPGFRVQAHHGQL